MNYKIIWVWIGLTDGEWKDNRTKNSIAKSLGGIDEDSWVIRIDNSLNREFEYLKLPVDIRNQNEKLLLIEKT